MGEPRQGLVSGLSNHEIEASLENGTSKQEFDSEVPTHPLGIKPLGNQCFSTPATSARLCTGTLEALPDELLAQLLEYLDQWTLRALGYTCRFLFAFCLLDDLWKTLFLESRAAEKRRFTWLGSWRSTLLQLPQKVQAKIYCSGVFSDVLHRPFVCSNVHLERFSSNIPSCNEIKRFKAMTHEEFENQWSDTPFILTEAVRSWPVQQSWTLEKLRKMYADVEFRAEAVDWPFSTYYDYMLNNRDESPLYLFDKMFAEKMRINVGEVQGAAYWAPDCFGPDLFELLGSERPAHKWLIIGPKRGGSTFHKDPNATSAWNAVIQGTKYWIMFPPTAQVPGVYVSKDNSEVTSPLSIAEWLLEFHGESRQLSQCIEGICQAGEILHVPSGWWHLVVNLQEGIALTQNFVPKAHLADVLEFLKEKPGQVTGFERDVANPYGVFEDRLRQIFPELLEQAHQELERRHSRKRKWDDAIATDNSDQTQRSGGFCFRFGSRDGDVDEIP